MSLSDQFAEFERKTPPDLFGDPIWRLPAYRIALFLADRVGADLDLLRKRKCSPHIIGQLERAVHSIGVNIAEGYSRFSGRERARYYEIALGSAREAREWYRRALRQLGEQEASQRAYLLTRVVKILTVAIPNERTGTSPDRIRRRRGAAKAETQEPETRSAADKVQAPASSIRRQHAARSKQ